MATEIVPIDRTGDYRPQVAQALAVLRAGGLVGFPTETVYGVGARADSADAVARLRDVKSRADTKPFSVHVGRVDQVTRFVPEMGPRIRRLIRKALPGPVTLVFEVADPTQAPVVQEAGPHCVELMYHAGTIGIRCPDDAVAGDLLGDAEFPVVAASANRVNQPPPRSAEGVVAELDGRLDLLLDGGETRYAQASTVVRLRGDAFEVLRAGIIEERTLRRYASLNILFVCSGNTCRSPMAETMCRAALAERLSCSVADLADRDITVQSAGTAGWGGSPASQGAVGAMARRQLDLAGHVAKSLDVETIHQADHIYCMTRSHREAVLALVPSAAERTVLLADDGEIADPFGGSDADYVACAADIDAALRRRMDEMLG
jgi:L-threonylcarbamoyladenylate synthase